MRRLELRAYCHFVVSIRSTVIGLYVAPQSWTDFRRETRKQRGLCTNCRSIWASPKPTKRSRRSLGRVNEMMI